LDDQYAPIAEFYDLVVPYRRRPDVGFFVDAARECSGRVLEVGCGTGRVLIPIAKAGVEISGLDVSGRMLSVCRERLNDEPGDVQSRVELVQADMRSFDLGKTFALATVPFRPFLHLLTVADQLACLSCIWRHLVSDGRLILDLFNPSLDILAAPNAGEEHSPEEEFVMPDGRRVVRWHRVVRSNRFDQVNDYELVYYVTHPDGRVERLVHGFPLRYIFRFEAEHLLTRAGFAVEQLYAGYDKTPYGSTYPGELIFVARKNG